MGARGRSSSARVVMQRRVPRGLAGRDGGVQVSEIQRSRLLAAALWAFDELGYDGASVTRITARARVSRRTFYELFENREECLIAVFDNAIERITAEILAADLQGLSWRERVRGGLWAILSFFDREPALARVCVIQVQRAGGVVFERRQEIVDRLCTLVDEGRQENARAATLGALTSQAVVGGVFSILHGHIADRGQSGRQQGSMSGLLGDLMATIVLPYSGAQAATREQERSTPAVVPVPAATAADRTSLVATTASFDRLAQIPMRLTYRTARVLQDIGEHPGSSNREVAERVEIHDQGQVSKLLARLQRLGLLANAAQDASVKGEANDWRLTSTGQQVASTINAHTGTSHMRIAS